MKKIISIISLIIMFGLLIFATKVYAVSLDTISIETDKDTVNPGEEVTLTIKFGEQLGAYTFNIAYDSNIFEYSSVDGGTANDTSDKVIVTFYDSTGGTNPRESMTITFKAKSDLTTSNPTEFTVTAEGIANADASVTYDDITTPIVKNITVEPDYVDYTIDLDYTGNIIANEEKEMIITYSSSMGKYYEHARLIGSATTPEGATVTLIGTDEEQLEHDIIQSGWGDAQGYSIGGKDVSQVLNTTAKFTAEGTYTITLSLIDRDNSDTVIAENTFNITVSQETVETEPEEEENDTNTTDEENSTNTSIETETPETLPKTGENIYVPIIISIISLLGVIFIYRIKNNKK